jgi:diguanylate cyclase (GGDEF)-like protein/PAS domain S-box-containing protein
MRTPDCLRPSPERADNLFMDVQLDIGSPAAPGDTAGWHRVRDLLNRYPGAAVAIVDFTRNLSNARDLLAASGIDIGGHTTLRGTVAAEFVAPSDAWLVSDALIDAGRHGTGTRGVHLKDGREATLHLIRVDELHLSTGFVMVIVPGSDGTLEDTAAPSVVAAATRVGRLYADGSGAVTRAEDSFLSVLGRERAEVVGHAVVSLVYPDDVEAAIAHWIAAKEQRGVAHRWRGRLLRGDGSLLWVEVTLANRIDDAGDGDVRVEINDISREVAAAEALAVERSLLKELTETLPVGVAKFDADGRIEYANAQLTNLLGRDPAAVIAAAIAGEIPMLADAFALLLREGTASRFIGERRREQFDRDLEWTLRPVTSETGEVAGGVLCVADVTEATALRAALEARATTDALTGCLNWAGTIDCLQRALAAASPGAGIGLLFIDLDGFKGINDDHGHAVGDRVLEIVALRLRNAVRPFDKIGRLGGDEFVVISPGLPSLEGADALAARVSEEVNGRATVADLRVEISASVGVAWADSGDADVLLAEADRAMYLAKCAPPVPAPTK